MKGSNATTTDVPKATERLVQLEGLRGLAILNVVLSHCGILNQGGMSNALFFALAGFLLINPFKDSYEQRFLSLKGVAKFYKSRAIRILPMYYLVLLFIFLQTGFEVIPEKVFLGLLIFNARYRHLWYIFSYFWVMLIIPLVFVVLLLLAKKIKGLNNDLVCALVFIALAFLIRLFVVWKGCFDIRFDQLMTGICFGYLFRFVRSHQKENAVLTKYANAADLLILMIFTIVVFTSDEILVLINPNREDYWVGSRYIFAVGFMMSLLIFLVCLYPNGVMGKLLSSKPLVFVGKYSFPIYLLNNFIIDQMNIEIREFKFLCVFSTSLIIAWILDTVINKAILLCQNAKMHILANKAG